MKNSPHYGADVFWSEIAPCEHLLQMYSDDSVFLDSLTGFVQGGMEKGEGVIVIATPIHLAGLQRRLAGILNLVAAIRNEQLVMVDAHEALSRFMVRGWPDDERFEAMVNELLVRVRGDGRRVRAFGEMVALLWGEGHSGATVRLEHLWHDLCHRQSFSLMCAYPAIGSTQDFEESMRDIREAHTHMVCEPQSSTGTVGSWSKGLLHSQRLAV